MAGYSVLPRNKKCHIIEQAFHCYENCNSKVGRDKKNFSLLQNVQTGCGAHPKSTGGCVSESEIGREADHWPPFSTE
jgi:hypothetical protein